MRIELMKQSTEEYQPMEYLPQPIRQRTRFLLKMGAEGVAVATFDEFDDATAAIRGVAVSKEHQGQGLGRLLFRELWQIAENRNIVMLHVNADPQALTFYKRLGFVENVWGATELEDVPDGTIIQVSSTCNLNNRCKFSFPAPQ
ncbi:MAG: GNAT family N-acetyltransferase [Paracoccaceae bacterium]